MYLNIRKEQDCTTQIQKRKNIKPVFNKLIIYAIFIIFTILTIFPLVWLFYSSFKPLIEIIRNTLAFPKHWTFSNYIDAVKIGKLDIYFINSIIYTVVSTASTILFSMMASFAFAKIKNRATPFLHSLFLIGLLISIQVILIPLFIAMRSIGLTDSRLGVIIVYTAINIPFAIYLETEYIKGIPNSVIESAQIDGASYYRIFANIIMPMCAPVLATILIIDTIVTWNEFILVFILTSSDAVRSLPVGIFSFTGVHSSEYGLQFAALVIGIIPLITLYAFLHKQITRGFATGVVKE